MPRTALRTCLGACLALALLLTTGLEPAGAQPAPKTRASNIDLTKEGLFPTEVVGPLARPSMATIEAVGLPYSGASLASPFQRTVRKIGGTGFVLTPDGYILTSPHTVQDAEFLKVTIEGETYEAKHIADDEFYEVSLIKIDDPKARGVRFQPVRWGNSDQMPVGSPVVVVGSPVSLDKTLTYGFVTNIRDVRLRGAGGLSTGVLVPDGIEIDAAIVPSNYGGPVFNAQAEVIGIVNRRSTAGRQQNLNYTIPSNIIKPIVDQMLARGRAFHPWFGVEPYIPYANSKNLAIYLGVPLREINPETNEPYGIVGVLVGAVAVASPAAEAGLARGDLLLKFDGRMIKDTKALEVAVLGLRENQSFTLTLVRNGQVISKRITIADRPTIKEMQDRGIQTQFYGI